MVMTMASTPSLHASSRPLLILEAYRDEDAYCSVREDWSRMPTPADEAIETFLELYPPGIVRQAEVLRSIVRRAVPSAVERLRPGWKLIGYDLPIGKHGTYFAWVWPQREHGHVGGEMGTLMSDPRRLLQGAHLGLKKVRYLTYEPEERIPSSVVVAFTRDAARIASMSRAERQLLAASLVGSPA